MSVADTKICSNCAFYRSHANAEGMCFLRPPVTHAYRVDTEYEPHIDYHQSRPIVEATDFCSSWSMSR